MNVNDVMGETMIMGVYNISNPEPIYYKTKCAPSCNSSIICAQYDSLSRCERCGGGSNGHFNHTDLWSAFLLSSLSLNDVEDMKGQYLVLNGH
jgi:hypothetical protein